MVILRSESSSRWRKLRRAGLGNKSNFILLRLVCYRNSRLNGRYRTQKINWIMFIKILKQSRLKVWWSLIKSKCERVGGVRGSGRRNYYAPKKVAVLRFGGWGFFDFALSRWSCATCNKTSRSRDSANQRLLSVSTNHSISPKLLPLFVFFLTSLITFVIYAENLAVDI